MASSKKVAGALAEFANPAELIDAAEKVRDAGFKQFDCHSPFPIHGMDDAMGEKRSPLGYIVGTVAILAFVGMMGFQLWTSGVAYPLVLSGKPYFSYQAFGVASWAVMVLSSAITAVLGMLALNKLPQYHHPVFYSDNFGKVTTDGFFVSIESGDEKFDDEQTRQFLESIGGKNVELLEEE